jgi:hypothetical protein
MDGQLLSLLRSLREGLTPADLEGDAADTLFKLSADFADACARIASQPLQRRDELLA